MANTPEEMLLTAIDRFGEDSVKVILQPQTYIELAFIAGGLTLALLLAAVTHHYSKYAKLENASNNILRTMWEISSKLALPMATMLFLAIANAIANSILGAAELIEGAGKLAFAWLAYKVAAMVIRNRFLSILAGIALFTLAILDITDLEKPTAAYLSSITVGIAEFKMSLLALLQGALLFMVLIWLARLVSRLVEHHLYHSTQLGFSTRELILKMVKIGIYAVVFLITLNVVGIDLTAFAVFGGALGVGIGLGLQKVTSNFISGIILLMEKSVKVGDLIEVGNSNQGWVRQLAIRHTRVEMADGQEVLIPNEELMTNRVTNWTLSSRRARIKILVPVGYKSDMAQVKKILLDAATAHPRCIKDPAPAVALNGFTASGVEMELVFWVKDVSEGLGGAKSDVLESILNGFRQHDIRISYPRQELYIRERETLSKL